MEIIEIRHQLETEQPVFSLYSQAKQEEIVQEIYAQSKLRQLDAVKTQSLIRGVLLKEPRKLDQSNQVVFSLLMADPKWKEKIVQDKTLESLFFSVCWERNPDLSLEARKWIYNALQHAEEMISSQEIRKIYVRNLLSYLPFFAPKEGEIISIPQAQGGVLEYRIEPVPLTPSFLGSPLMAYGLIPLLKDQEKASPFLLFKGTTYPTDEGCYLSVLTDINPFAPVGSYLFHFSGKQRIESWLAKNVHGMKAEVMGTSLGGALSLHTASYLPQYLQAAYAFNSPGMSSVECRAWKQKTKEEKPRVEVYLQKGDPVSEFVGSKFSSDWAVYQVYAEDQDPFQSHASMFLAYPESFVIPLDAQKVNEHRVMWAWVQNILFIPLFLLNLLLWPFVWLCHFFIEKGFSQSLPEKS